MVHFHIGWILNGAMSHSLSIKDPETAMDEYWILFRVELMVVTSAATSRRMWLAELASVGLRCDPYVPTSNQRS